MPTVVPTDKVATLSTLLIPLLHNCRGNRVTRLFACACARVTTPPLDKLTLLIIEEAEDVSDGESTIGYMEKLLRELVEKKAYRSPMGAVSHSSALYAAKATVGASLNRSPVLAQSFTLLLYSMLGPPDASSYLEIRFPPDVVGLAREVYEARGGQLLGVLADAAEDVGFCRGAEALRTDSVCKGHWALDMILGKF